MPSPMPSPHIPHGIWESIPGQAARTSIPRSYIHSHNIRCICIKCRYVLKSHEKSHSHAIDTAGLDWPLQTAPVVYIWRISDPALPTLQPKGMPRGAHESIYSV